jgi:hypothetical protein
VTRQPASRFSHDRQVGHCRLVTKQCADEVNDLRSFCWAKRIQMDSRDRRKIGVSRRPYFQGTLRVKPPSQQWAAKSRPRRLHRLAAQYSHQRVYRRQD